MAKKTAQSEIAQEQQIELGQLIQEAFFHQPIMLKVKGEATQYKNHIAADRGDCKGVLLYKTNDGVNLSVAGSVFFIPYTNVRYIKIK